MKTRSFERIWRQLAIGSRGGLVVIALCCLAGCVAGNDEDQTAAIEQSLEEFAMSGGGSARWTSALDSLLDAGERDGDMVRMLLEEKYGETLLHPTHYDRDGAKARALLYVAGRLGWAEDIGEYLQPGCDDAVLYALAEARGLKCYYAFVESGRYDRIVQIEDMKRIMRQSPLFQPWHEALADWEPYRPPAGSP